jgi:tRNA pseudouridine38-40 synthase
MIFAGYLCFVEVKRRFFLEIAYNGTSYHGWQVQENAVTVQEVLNKALKTLLREEVETVGCGRTDTGVHAREFFLHFDSHNPRLLTDNRIVHGINALLPFDIAVKRILPVGNDAHARFDAVLRSYEYHMHFHKDPFRHAFSWWHRDRPDIELMNRAASIIMEYSDFSCFSKSNTQTFTNNCIVSRAEWLEMPGGMIFHVSADRFLRNMVRAIVGTLIDVGRKKIAPETMHSIIESKNRSEAGTSVPACGLYLTEVRYPYISRA